MVAEHIEALWHIVGLSHCGCHYKVAAVVQTMRLPWYDSPTNVGTPFERGIFLIEFDGFSLILQA